MRGREGVSRREPLEAARQVREKRGGAESVATVCHEVTPFSDLPEAVLVDLSDVANQYDRRAAAGFERSRVFAGCRDHGSRSGTSSWPRTAEEEDFPAGALVREAVNVLYY